MSAQPSPNALLHSKKPEQQIPPMRKLALSDLVGAHGCGGWPWANWGRVRQHPGLQTTNRQTAKGPAPRKVRAPAAGHALRGEPSQIRPS